MSLEHIPKIDFAGVVTDTFDADHASINASEYSTSAKNQSLINTLVEIIAVYISDNIATDKNCLIQLSKVLYDANYKLLYKLSQDENFIDKLRQKLVITDSSASSKPALTSVDFDRMKNTIVSQVKAAIKDAVKKNKSETDRQINDVAKAFNADKDKPATSSSNVKIPDTPTDNTTPEQNTVETDDGTIDFNKLEPILPNTQLTPVWLTSRSAITNNLRKLNINASNRTIALLTVAFKKTTVQAAIDTLTGAIDQNAKAIHRTSAAALTATTVGATTGSMIGRAHKPSVFSRTSSFALGAKSALSKVGSVATSFFKGLFTVTKHIIVGLYKITKTILVSIAKLTKAVLVTVGNAIKFTFVTLPMTVFSGIKRIGKFINEKVLNTSIVKGIVGFLLSPAIVYIVGFIAGFITEKIKQAGGVRALLSNFFTGVKNRIVEGIKNAIDVVWAGIKKPSEVISGLKDKLRKKIEEKLKATEKEGVENPDNQKDSPVSKLKNLLTNTEIKESTPIKAAIKEFIASSRQHISDKAEEDRNNGKTKWKDSIWVFLDDTFTFIETKIVPTIKALSTGIVDIISAVNTKIKDIVDTITKDGSENYETKLADKINSLRSKSEYANKSEEDLKKIAVEELSEELGFTKDKGFFSDQNPLENNKLKQLFIVDGLNEDIGKKITNFKTQFLNKVDPIIKICTAAMKIAKSNVGSFFIEGAKDMLKAGDLVWITAIPHPVGQIIAGALMLLIRSIMAAFEAREKTKLLIDKRFAKVFGISISEASDKYESTFNNLDLYKSSIRWDKLLKEGVLKSSDFKNGADTDSSLRTVDNINRIAVKDRVLGFIFNLASEIDKIDDIVEILNRPVSNEGRFVKWLAGKKTPTKLEELLSSGNALPRNFSVNAITFPLIGIDKPLNITANSIDEYNALVLSLFHKKRAILGVLASQIFGAVGPNSISDMDSADKLFENAVWYSSDKYLKRFQDWFKPEYSDKNINSYKKIPELDELIKSDRNKYLKEAAGWNPLISYGNRIGLSNDDAVKLVSDFNNKYSIEYTSPYSPPSEAKEIRENPTSLLKKFAMPAIDNMLTGDYSPEIKAKLTAIKSRVETAVNSRDTQKINDLYSPDNGATNVVLSNQDVLPIILREAGFDDAQINVLIYNYKLTEDGMKKYNALTKKLIQALVFTNGELQKINTTTADGKVKSSRISQKFDNPTPQLDPTKRGATYSSRPLYGIQ